MPETTLKEMYVKIVRENQSVLGHCHGDFAVLRSILRAILKP